ncbi:MAG TPA: PfkB family carbohydrate kinase [Melioribacteraceae bacterium]|nr:PfkB family carbohydrate kinase [Melioribacteraceae bacterium]
MILTVTLNPLLEKRLYFNSLKLNSNNRSIKEEFKSGGKGINVSRQLNKLGLNNQAITFLGGQTGKDLRKILMEENINFFAVSSKSNTREAVIAVDNQTNNITTLFPVNPIITEAEAKDFAGKLEKMIMNCSIVVFSGSSPCSETDFIFPYGINLANKYDKISVLDTYGNHLKACIDAKPTVIHNNVEELNSSLGINISNEEDYLNILNDLYKKDIKLSFITNGDKETYCSKFNFHYKISNPKINQIDPTGSGDAFIAGIVYGLEKDFVFDEFIKIASALGAYNASVSDTCNFEFSSFNYLIESVNVSPIGKKMKLIDDSPTI